MEKADPPGITEAQEILSDVFFAFTITSPSETTFISPTA